MQRETVRMGGIRMDREDATISERYEALSDLFLTVKGRFGDVDKITMRIVILVFESMENDSQA